LAPESALTTDGEAERIRADLERTRLELSRSMAQLRQEAAATVDWRCWYQANPGPYILAAFTLGLFLGSVGHRR
jgi:hypothetical protein